MTGLRRTAIINTELYPHSLITTHKINLTITRRVYYFVTSGAFQNSFTTKGIIELAQTFILLRKLIKLEKLLIVTKLVLFKKTEIETAARNTVTKRI